MLCSLIPNGLPPALVAGLVAAIVGIAGWLVKSYVSGLIYFYKRFSDEVEMMIGLRAEIRVNMDAEKRLCASQLLDTLKSEYAADPRYKQFLPLFKENVIYDAFKKNVTSITEAPLEHVIRYYNLSGGLDVALASLTSERYEKFKPERKIEIYQSVQNEARDTVRAAEAAIFELGDAIRVTKAKRMGALVVSAFVLAAVVQSLVQFGFDGKACVNTAALRSAGTMAEQAMLSDERRKNGAHRLFLSDNPMSYVEVSYLNTPIGLKKQSSPVAPELKAETGEAIHAAA